MEYHPEVALFYVAYLRAAIESDLIQKLLTGTGTIEILIHQRPQQEAVQNTVKCFAELKF